MNYLNFTGKEHVQRVYNADSDADAICETFDDTLVEWKLLK